MNIENPAVLVSRRARRFWDGGSKIPTSLRDVKAVIFIIRRINIGSLILR